MNVRNMYTNPTVAQSKSITSMNSAFSEHLLSLDAQLAQFGEEKGSNQRALVQTLTANKEEAIISLGGLSNMIHLCLSHPHACEYIDPNQLSKFEDILTENNILSPGDSNGEQTGTNTSDLSGHAHVISDDNLTTSDNSRNKKDSSNLNDVTINTYGGSQGTEYVKSQSLGDYYRSKIILAVDVTDCWCFRLFGGSNLESTDPIQREKSWKIYKTVTGKKYIIPMIMMYLILEICGDIFNSNIKISYSLTSVARFLAIANIPIFWSIVNPKIFYVVVHTFDFWYKLLNFIIAAGAYEILAINVDPNYNDYPIWYNILIFISAFEVYFVAFIVDTFFINNRLKFLYLIILGVYTCVLAIWVYFGVDDFVWNPLQSEFSSLTQISFKSLYLSGSTNLALFLIKPVIGTLSRRATRKLCGNSFYSTRLGNLSHDQQLSRGVHESDVDCQRFWTIHKASFLSWQGHSQ